MDANNYSRIWRETMKTCKTLFTGLLVLGLLCLSGMAAAQEDTMVSDTTGTVLADDILPYDGPISAGSPLYGLKLAMENIDESFTTNQSELVDKQIGHGRLRIAEVRRALELNQSDSAQQALDLYWQKMNLTRSTIAPFRSNTTGLLHAQEQIAKHQVVLGNLLLSHPNNTGLQRAYNNSLELEEKFSEKTAIKFNRSAGKDNKTIIRAIKLEQKETERLGKPIVTMQSNETLTQQTETGKQEQQTETVKNQNKKPVSDTTTTVTTRPTPAVTGNQQQGGQSDDNQTGYRGNYGNRNDADTKGKDNSRNK
jgi:hypothetical protein